MNNHVIHMVVLVGVNPLKRLIRPFSLLKAGPNEISFGPLLN